MTTIIVDEDIASIEVPAEEAKGLPFKFCDEHQAELVRKLGVHQDLAHAVFHGVTSACCRSIGTVTVGQFGCPVCAVQKFDYIGEMVAIITSNYSGPSDGAKRQ